MEIEARDGRVWHDSSLNKLWHDWGDFRWEDLREFYYACFGKERSFVTWHTTVNSRKLK